ncbi:MAG: hypothetical protein COX30_00280 [Candidatus Moranbacteria bacterium CG23_combo_of_CG06-09_8_20_14_all_39_10]|nr:MAG: hypothetical protein COX30_00280 [Candidatus Moranbacteria bacterium CG23_combo_of_CG06-09_8_20_14_all_39_10]
MQEDDKKITNESATPKVIRGALQIVGGAVPFAGGLLSAAAGAWSESEQERVNKFLRHWIKMLEDEIKEKEKTILEIMVRLNIHDEEIAKRLESKEYQSLLKKTFREWSGAESDDKRIYIRNILANAAASSVTIDEVIRLFIDWLKMYSELHFKVIAVIYKHGTNGVSRGGAWSDLGKVEVAENSADADLFKLLFRDLSTGGVIRQHREVDYYGNFVPKTSQRRQKGSGPRPITSAFDDEDSYELTELGKQFVHYAMTDLPLKIEYNPENNSNE